MPAAQGNVRWEASVTSDSRFKRVDDEGLVFDSVRWETRLLTTVPAAVLEALLQSPATAEELAEKVATSQPALQSPREVLERVRQVLDELSKLDLVRPCGAVPDADR